MKYLLKILTLALCAALLLSATAFAAETPAEAAEPSAVQTLAPVQIWGTAAKEENGSLLITSGDPDSSNPEVLVRVSEETFCVDAATGLPLDMESVKDGDTLYVWAGPAMTMSLPPQTNAVVVVGNIPADSAAPQYAEITAPAGDGERVFPSTAGELKISETAEVTAFRTKNIVKLDDLVPGTQLLAWTGSDGQIDRILVFPYAYAGYLSADASGVVRLDGEELQGKSRVLPVEDIQAVYLPLRAIAENGGYEVDWVSGKGAVVSLYGTELFSVQAGSAMAQTPDGEVHGLLGGCVIDSGVTYLPAGDMARLLNMYYVYLA